VKSKRLENGMHVSNRGKMRNAYRIFFWKALGKHPLGRPRRWENEIKMDRRDIGWGWGVKMKITQDRVQWWRLVLKMLNLDREMATLINVYE
jgi:hypothetical protein